jgi:hypothetical protein
MQCNRTLDIQLPDMTHKYQVPYKITVMQLSGPQDNLTEEPAKSITCKVAASAELLNLGEPYFQLNHVINLEDNWAQVRASGRVKVTLTSKQKEVRRFRVYADYRECFGGVIYEDKVDKFDSILSTIHERGRCSKLTITCPKPLKSLDFVTTFSCTEGDWIDSFGANVESDPSTVYSFDFTSGDLKDYVDYLKYLQLQVAGFNPTEDIFIYVTAYGFPNSKN